MAPFARENCVTVLESIIKDVKREKPDESSLIRKLDFLLRTLKKAVEQKKITERQDMRIKMELFSNKNNLLGGNGIKFLNHMEAVINQITDGVLVELEDEVSGELDNVIPFPGEKRSVR